MAGGAEFKHIAIAANDWYAVKVESQVGWVSGKNSEILSDYSIGSKHLLSNRCHDLLSIFKIENQLFFLLVYRKT